MTESLKDLKLSAVFPSHWSKEYTRKGRFREDLKLSGVFSSEARNFWHRNIYPIFSFHVVFTLHWSRKFCKTWRNMEDFRFLVVFYTNAHKSKEFVKQDN